MDDLHGFSERLKRLYSHWETQGDLWGSCNVLTFANSGQKVNQPTTKSTKSAQRRDTLRLKGSVVSKWLFGRVIYKSIFVFEKKQIHCLSSTQEVSFLKLVGQVAKDSVGVDFQLYVKPDYDDCSGLMDAIVNKLDAGIFVGFINEGRLKGELSNLWFSKLNKKMKADRSIQLVDANKGWSQLLSVKDSDEIEKIKKAACFSTSVMKKIMIPEADKVIKGEEKVPHSSMSEKTLEAIRQLSNDFSIASPPVFQSGHCFDLKPPIFGAPCDNNLLEYSSQSAIICSVGIKFGNYCSFIARTFLIDPIDLQRKAYEVLCKAQEAAIRKLMPGNKASDAYEAAMTVVKKESPELSGKLKKNAGSSIGLELQESGCNLDEKNGELLKEGMVLNVSLGFQNLKNNIKGKCFSLWIADCVIVNHVGPEVLTAGCSKFIEDIEDITMLSADGEGGEIPPLKRRRTEVEERGVDWARNVFEKIRLEGGFVSVALSKDLQGIVLKAVNILLSEADILSPCDTSKMEEFREYLKSYIGWFPNETKFAVHANLESHLSVVDWSRTRTAELDAIANNWKEKTATVRELKTWKEKQLTDLAACQEKQKKNMKEVELAKSAERKLKELEDLCCGD